jgi:hypothetical protein
MAASPPTDHISPQIRTAADRVISFRLPSADGAEILRTMQKDAEGEASSAKAILLDEHGMTPMMSLSCVSPVREAMADFRAAVGDFRTAITPKLREMDKMDTLTAEIAAKTSETAAITGRIEAKWKSLAGHQRVLGEYGEAKREWDPVYRRQGSRLPQMFPGWAYILMLVVIGAVEWLVNYNSFLENFGAPAMAAGFTIAVAAAVAFASHEHGTLLKQRAFWFGETAHGFSKTTKLIWVGFATLALTLSLVFVAWNRYNWGIEMLRQMGMGTGSDIIGGVAIVPINITQKVLMSTLANVIVWSLGVAVAYWTHDTHPDLVSRYKRWKKAEKAFEADRKKIDQEIKRELAVLNDEIEGLKNTAASYDAEFRPLNDLRNQVEDRAAAIEHEAEALVSRLATRYRRMLHDLAKAGNPDIQFNHGGSIIDLAAFSQLSVRKLIATEHLPS